jgi:hypothetical protein
MGLPGEASLTGMRPPGKGWPDLAPSSCQTRRRLLSALCGLPATVGNGTISVKRPFAQVSEGGRHDRENVIQRLRCVPGPVSAEQATQLGRLGGATWADSAVLAEVKSWSIWARSAFIARWSRLSCADVLSISAGVVAATRLATSL